MKALILLTLFGIVSSLGHALFTMASGSTDSKRMVQALTVRIGLSVALFAFLLIGWHFGSLTPHATP